MLSGTDDAAGVLGNMGMAPSPWQLYFTAEIAVAVVDAAAVALAVGIAFGTSLVVAVVIGAAAAVLAVGAAIRF
jgi:hypothetical protein